MSRQLPTQHGRPFPDRGRSHAAIEQLQGIVQEVNLLDRDLMVHAGMEAAVVDVPPDCPVYLHGERIKLRLLQPNDNVSIAFVRRDERLVAQRVEVEPTASL